MPITTDLSRWPIVVVTWDGTVPDSELAAHHAQMTEIVRRDAKKLVIYDATNAAIPGPVQRKMQADWMKANEFAIKKNSIGTAFVLSSTLMRGALTAVFWIQGMATEHHVCATLSEALGWCQRRAEGAGIPSTAPSHRKG